VSTQSRIIAVSPAVSAGTVDVTVTTPCGTSATSSADQFSFAAAGALTLRVTIESTGTGASFTVAAAGPTLNNSFLVMLVVTTGGATVGAPSGWTAYANNNDGTDEAWVQVFYWAAAPPYSGGDVWTLSSGPFVYNLFEYYSSGVPSLDAPAGNTAQGVGTALASLSGFSTAANDVVVCCGVCPNSVAFMPGITWASGTPIGGGEFGGAVSAFAAAITLTSLGTQANFLGTFGASTGWGTVLIAISP